ncbi:11 TM domain-containing transmembrane protein [Acrasis kona]|uniref:Chloride channel protein n=1 Tax=Acrasis kona TaxID=1008807 RepID=A0AAW2YGS3_9EUKA
MNDDDYDANNQDNFTSINSETKLGRSESVATDGFVSEDDYLPSRYLKRSNSEIELATFQERVKAERELSVPEGSFFVRNYRAITKFLKHDAKEHERWVWTFLTLVGLTGGTISFVHDEIIAAIFQLRRTLIAAVPSSFAGQMILWILFNFILVYIALNITYWISPAAEGSGIPPIKAIVNGAPLTDPLSFRTLVAKTLALPIVLGSGLFLGKVGPAIHMGALISNNMMNLRIFHPIRKNDKLKMQMITCGTALGVGANFGAPTGGVFFAMEIVGTFYSLRNYLKIFYVCVLGALTERLFLAVRSSDLYLHVVWNTNFTMPGFAIPEFILYLLLGVLLGLFGIVFIYCNRKLLELRDTIGKRRLFVFTNRFKSQHPLADKFLGLLENRFIWTMVISIVTSVFTFPGTIGHYYSLAPKRTMEDLLSYDLNDANGQDWTKGDIFTNLIVFFIIRTILTLFSISLPIPGGMYVPLLVMGGAFGRIFGEVMRGMFPLGFMDTSPINPGGYALVGAVALTGSVTHAFSTVFIISDITGIVFHLPNLITAFISIRLSMSVMTSIYDSVIKLRKWDVLLEPNTDRENIVVKEVMTKMGEKDALSEQCSIYDTLEFLKRHEKEHGETNSRISKQVPIVYSKRSMVLTGAINTNVLKKETQDFINLNAGINLQDPSAPPFLPYGVNTQPFLLTEDTPVLQAHALFSAVKIELAYVVRNGRLVGCMHKRDVTAVSGEKNSSLGRFLSHMKRVNSWKVLTGAETAEQANKKHEDTLMDELPEMAGTRAPHANDDPSTIVHVDEDDVDVGSIEIRSPSQHDGRQL